MPRQILGLSLVCLVFAGWVSGADPTKDAQIRQLSALIDQQIEASWVAEGVKPAPIADDAEFLRRVYLDLVGRIPRVAEVTEFLGDSSSEKRQTIVVKLLAMPASARHFAATTRQEWLPQASTDARFFFSGVQFEQWLETQYRKNVPYDVMVRELLMLPMPDGLARFRNLSAESQSDPESQRIAAFYQANESRPENLAAAATRLFMGVKLELRLSATITRSPAIPRINSGRRPHSSESSRPCRRCRRVSSGHFCPSIAKIRLRFRTPIRHWSRLSLMARPPTGHWIARLGMNWPTG